MMLLLTLLLLFLHAAKHLYKRVCTSVSPSVTPFQRAARRQPHRDSGIQTCYKVVAIVFVGVRFVVVFIWLLSLNICRCSYIAFVVAIVVLKLKKCTPPRRSPSSAPPQQQQQPQQQPAPNSSSSLQIVDATERRLLRVLFFGQSDGRRVHGQSDANLRLSVGIQNRQRSTNLRRRPRRARAASRLSRWR